jgi:putative transposase
MRDLLVLFIHFIATLARLLRAGGARSIVAESLLLRHQASTPDPESLPATSAESVRVGPDPCRLAGAVAASLSPAPVCHCAEALNPAGPSPSDVQAKYRRLFSSNHNRKPGPKGPSAEFVHAIVEMKQRNPRWGGPRIAEQITLAFNLAIDKDVVRRILSHHHWPGPGPAIGQLLGEATVWL